MSRRGEGIAVIGVFKKSKKNTHKICILILNMTQEKKKWLINSTMVFITY